MIMHLCWPSQATHGCLCAFYLPSILLTHPWLTRSWREMSQGRTPWWASSTIRCRTTSGRGLPLTNTPPSWFTPPCPTRQKSDSEEEEGAIWQPSSSYWEIQTGCRQWNETKKDWMGVTKLCWWYTNFWGLSDYEFHCIHNQYKYSLIDKIMIRYFTSSLVSKVISSN